MKTVIEKAIEWFKDISEATKELTSGNVSHKACAIRGLANGSAEYLEEYKRGLSAVKWQTGEPKEGGYYLITTDSGRITTDLWRIFPNRSNWEYRNKFEVRAWCKLSDIEPYKEE